MSAMQTGHAAPHCSDTKKANDIHCRPNSFCRNVKFFGPNSFQEKTSADRWIRSAAHRHAAAYIAPACTSATCFPHTTRSRAAAPCIGQSSAAALWHCAQGSQRQGGGALERTWMYRTTDPRMKQLRTDICARSRQDTSLQQVAAWRSCAPAPSAATVAWTGTPVRASGPSAQAPLTTQNCSFERA